MLSEEKIIQFVEKYQLAHIVESVTFCGGEVFLLPYMTHMINALTNKGLLVQIITNGTIDKLKEIKSPNSVNCIVSVDGLPSYHDQNRGGGMFNKSITFLKKAKKLGFHTEIFSIVTRQNYPQINQFESYMEKEIQNPVPITYHPRKPMEYLTLHPVSNNKGTINGFDFLEKKEMRELLKTKKTFPPQNFGCYQIAVMSDGKIYGCCEGRVPLGTIHDDVKTLIDRLNNKIGKTSDACLGCSDPGFLCGMRKYIT